MTTNTRIIKPRIEFADKSGLNEAMTDGILSVTTHKSINNLMGGGEIHIVPFLDDKKWQSLTTVVDEWYHRIDLNDKIRVTIEDVNSEQPNWLMTAAVDNIVRTRTTLNNQTQHGILIRFSDWTAKKLMRDEITFLPEITLLENREIQELFGRERLNFLYGMIGKGLNNETGQSVFMGGRVGEALKYILDNMPLIKRGDGVVYYHKDNSDDPYDKTTNVDFSQLQGIIAEQMYSVIDKQFYELYSDTFLTENLIVWKPKPFDDNDWEKLTMHEIKDEDIISDQVGISDYELKNVFRCFNNYEFFGSQDSDMGRYGYNFPILNLTSIEKFGVRNLNGTSRLVNSSIEILKETEKKSTDATSTLAQTDDIASAIVRKRNKLFRWYAYPFYESGQIKIRGNQNIRIGQRIYQPDKTSVWNKDVRGLEYYVSDVVNSWTYAGIYTTQLNVTRGHQSGNKDVWEYLKSQNIEGLGKPFKTGQVFVGIPE